MTRYRIVCGPELSYHYNMGFGADRHKKKKVVDLEGSFYFDFEKQKTYTVHLMPREIGTLLITDSFTAGRWTFMSDTRNIKGYKCKLAVTENFKHDSTFVWYTEQIPFRAGPAKFFGFPGLVLEVIDRIEHVHFKVSAIKDRSSGIVLPAYPILSRKEYFEKY
jgi:GLPGLI family protein